MPQERIDEESHPGVLADIIHDTSSSSESTTGSSDTDTTSGSHSTMKHRIKRAFQNRRRRKSNANSEDTRSVPSALPSPPSEQAPSSSQRPISRGRRGCDLGAIASGDEADHEKPISNFDTVPKVRDFETSAGPGGLTVSPDRVSSPESAHRLPKPRRTKHKKKHKSTKSNGQPASEMYDAAQAAASAGSAVPRVEFIDQSQRPPGTASSGTSKGRTGAHWRPPLPKLLSQNVFMEKVPITPQSPIQRPRVRRASSLPDLSRMSTVPGRGLRPSQLPKPPTPRQPTAESESDEEDPPQLELSRTAAVVMLLVSTGLVALCAEFLVDAIPAMTASSSVSQTFIGLIILPIVGNAAEHVTAVTVAMKNKMDLSIGVAVGSSIQIGKLATHIRILPAKLRKPCLSLPWLSLLDGLGTAKCLCISPYLRPSHFLLLLLLSIFSSWMEEATISKEHC
jgi:Ca2+:H+ antiporter